MQTNRGGPICDLRRSDSEVSMTRLKLGHLPCSYCWDEDPTTATLKRWPISGCVWWSLIICVQPPPISRALQLRCATAVCHTSLRGMTSLSDAHLANADRRWVYTTQHIQLQVVRHWAKEAEHLALKEHSANAAVCRLDTQKEGKRTWLLQRAERSLQVDCGYLVSLLAVPSFLVQVKMYIGSHVKRR